MYVLVSGSPRRRRRGKGLSTLGGLDRKVAYTSTSRSVSMAAPIARRSTRPAAPTSSAVKTYRESALKEVRESLGPSPA